MESASRRVPDATRRRYFYWLLERCPRMVAGSSLAVAPAVVALASLARLPLHPRCDVQQFPRRPEPRRPRVRPSDLFPFRTVHQRVRRFARPKPCAADLLRDVLPPGGLLRICLLTRLA